MQCSESGWRKMIYLKTPFSKGILGTLYGVLACVCLVAVFTAKQARQAARSDACFRRPFVPDITFRFQPVPLRGGDPQSAAQQQRWRETRRIELRAILLIAAALIGGLLAGRQFPSHRYEPAAANVPGMVLDRKTGHICDWRKVEPPESTSAPSTDSQSKNRNLAALMYGQPKTVSGFPYCGNDQ